MNHNRFFDKTQKVILRKICPLGLELYKQGLTDRKIVAAAGDLPPTLRPTIRRRLHCSRLSISASGVERDHRISLLPAAGIAAREFDAS